MGKKKPSQRKRARSSYLPSALRSNNKWARRGRNLAHAVMGTLITIATYIADLLILICQEVGHEVGSILEKRRQRKAEEATRTANKEEKVKADNSKSSSEKSADKTAKEPVTKPPRKVNFSPVVIKNKLSMDDIAGLEHVKSQLEQKLNTPLTRPRLAEAFKLKRGGGMLLIGPGGVGKTLIGMTIACEVDADFFLVTPADILKPRVDVALIKELFSTVRSYKKVVVFLDEIEAIGPSRRKHGGHVNRVNQLLVETDNLAKRHAEQHKDGFLLLIGATNNPEVIDENLKRGGRFEVEIFVPLPDQPAREFLLQKNLRGRACSPDLDIPGLAQKLEGWNCADIIAVTDKAASMAADRNVAAGVGEDDGSEILPIVMDDLESAMTFMKKGSSDFKASRKPPEQKVS